MADNPGFTYEGEATDESSLGAGNGCSQTVPDFSAQSSGAAGPCSQEPIYDTPVPLHERERHPGTFPSLYMNQALAARSPGNASKSSTFHALVALRNPCIDEDNDKYSEGYLELTAEREHMQLVSRELSSQSPWQGVIVGAREVASGYPTPTSENDPGHAEYEIPSPSPHAPEPITAGGDIYQNSEVSGVRSFGKFIRLPRLVPIPKNTLAFFRPENIFHNKKCLAVFVLVAVGGILGIIAAVVWS